MFSRRHFLRSMAGAAALSVVQPAFAERRRLVPVNVSADRVIRTVVGLRPYRPGGFVVREERFGDKRVIHNYGHGGGGITLSWGTSELALELGWNPEVRNYAVLGCGCVGLATARLLQDRGAHVTIYARELPPHTTSNIAGGQWGPASVVDYGKRTPAWDAQFSKAAFLSHRTYQNLVGDEYGVKWLPNYRLSEKPTDYTPLSLSEAVEVVNQGPAESPFPGYYARRYQTMMIEPAHYLRRLEDEFYLAGGRIEVRFLESLEALQDIPEEIIVNCTGLGSRELFGDKELIPVRGQLSVLLPQPEIDYAYIADGFYMFPRRDGVILGGTYGKGQESLEPDAAQAARNLEFHARLSRGMQG